MMMGRNVASMSCSRLQFLRHGDSVSVVLQEPTAPVVGKRLSLNQDDGEQLLPRMAIIC